MKSLLKVFYWLLIWLGLGMVLFGVLGFFVSKEFMDSTRVGKELCIVKDLQVAIKSFEVEYGFFPLSKKEHSSDDLILDSANRRLVGALVGHNLPDNPRAIKFIDLPIAKNGKGGLVLEKGGYCLFDFLGNPYQILMDTNRNGRIRNPDNSNSDPEVRRGAPEELPTGVAVFGRGKDGILNTGDDITSWRAHRSSKHPINLDLNLEVLGMILTIIGISGVLLSRGPISTISSSSEDRP